MRFFGSSGRDLAPDHVMLTLHGGARRIAVRRSARARRASLRVPASGGDPVLTLPPRGRLPDALVFLEAHKGWLEEKLARQPNRVAFEPGAVLPLRGERVRIVHRPDLAGACRLAAGPDGTSLVVPGAGEHIARRVTDFLKREARRDLEAAIGEAAAALSVRPGRITLRDAKTRWGSCSHSGALSFSWRIVLAPPPVLAYLAAHEVAHLKEMNHGPAFWSLVRRICPDMDDSRAWLKAHGPGLHAYG